MTRRVDLDAARKAREEAQGEPSVVVLGGREFTLPPSPPAAFLVGLGRLQKGDLSGTEEALQSLFGDQVDDILRLGLEIEDLGPIVNEAYGIDLGEASASG